MGTFQTWRKAYGALKDSTKVGLAKVNSEFKELDIAIVKATNHEECPPKERHIRKIFSATSITRPRADVAYCIYALARRLTKTRNWTEYQEKNLLTYKQEEAALPPESPKPSVEDEKPLCVESEEPPVPISEPTSQSTTTGDLLGLDEINPAAAELEQSNALALAIISPGDDAKTSTNNDLFGSGTNASGWELALVTTPSSNNSHLVDSKLAGGFDRLLLDSLYEDSARRQQITAAYPFDTSRDPFAMSKSIAPPSNVQMAMMAQQQQQQQQYYNPQQQQQQHQMMLTMMPHASQPQYPHSQLGLANPFGDPFVGFSQGAPP